MMKHRPTLSILCLLALIAMVRPAPAQTAADKQLSDELIRTAISFLGYAQVTESDAPFLLSGTLMDAALQLDPKNADAWALRAELAQTAGDTERYESALAGYLATGIKDERAQYKLIRYRLSKSTTLDEQMRSLEQLLDSEAGRAMTGPLRSRLASLASSIAAELLDQRAQRKWAVEAARADPANTEAAQAMLALVLELKGDTVRVGTATVNVIRADPLAPAPRIDLATLLAQEAAFERAAQQYNVVATRLSLDPLPIPAYLSWAQSLAMIGEDAIALQLIEQLDTALKAPAGNAGNDNEQQATDKAPADEPLELPIQFELIRLAVLDSEDDKAAAQAVLDRIAERIEKAEKPDAPAEGDAKDTPSEYDPAGYLAMIAAAFGPDLDKAEQYANQVQAGKPARDIALGWLAIRRGDKAKAEERLRPFAGKDTMADAGLAMVLGQDSAGRARLLSAVIQQTPGSLASLAAGRALVAMAVKPTATDTGKTLTNLMGKYPESFWLVDVERTPWLEVRMKIDPQRIAPFEPVKAEITVWNTSRFPLSIDDQGPVRQHAMVLISATSSGLPMAPNPPIVVDLGRRYTLDAGERMTFDTRLDYHRFGLLRSTNPGLPLVFDARLVVNPVMTPGGNWLANGIGGISEVRNCLIQSSPVKPQDIDNWLAALKGDDQAKRLEALIRLCYLNKKFDEGVVTPELLRQISPSMIEVWENGSESERALMILSTRELYKESTSYPELLGLAKKSESKLVWLALLTRHVDTGDSQLLTDAFGEQAVLPEVASFAERQRRLLREYEAVVAEQERLRKEQELLQGPGDAPLNQP